MNDIVKFPFYAKLAFTLTTLVAIFVILYYGQSIITPVLISMLFAILLEPIVKFLKRRLRFPHVIASIFAITIFVLCFVGIVMFLSWQIGEMVSDWDKIKANANTHWRNFQDVIRDNFNLSRREQKELIDNATSESGKGIVGSTLVSVTDTLINFILIPIYTFLMLLYKTHFKQFLCKLFSSDHHAKLQEILMQIKLSVQSYIIGLFLEMVIVSTLTSVGFMIIGVEYALLLGVITGLLNLIPYIGIMFAGLLSIAATLTGNSELTLVLGVIIVNVIVQFIDNNLLVPMIVSSKVKINALVSIVGIIIGGAVAGIAGMFLAIPIIAIMKVIFDRIHELRPWGYLMGDDLPKTFKWRNMQFPLYDADSATDTININSDQPEVIFTETTTKAPPKSE